MTSIMAVHRLASVCLWAFLSSNRDREKGVHTHIQARTHTHIYACMHVCMYIDVGWLGIIGILDPLPTTISR